MEEKLTKKDGYEIPEVTKEDILKALEKLESKLTRVIDRAFDNIDINIDGGGKNTENENKEERWRKSEKQRKLEEIRYKISSAEADINYWTKQVIAAEIEYNQFLLNGWHWPVASVENALIDAKVNLKTARDDLDFLERELAMLERNN